MRRFVCWLFGHQRAMDTDPTYGVLIYCPRCGEILPDSELA